MRYVWLRLILLVLGCFTGSLFQSPFRLARVLLRSPLLYPAPRVGALSDDACLTSDCLSVAYIGLRSRTEMPRKTKIGTEVGHVTRDFGHHFQGQKVKRQLAGGGGILWRPLAQLVRDCWNSFCSKQYPSTGGVNDNVAVSWEILVIWHFCQVWKAFVVSVINILADDWPDSGDNWRYEQTCRRHPMHPNTTVSDNAHIHYSCLHIPLTCLTVILLHAWCTKTVISTSHSISSVLFIYMYWLAFCRAI